MKRVMIHALSVRWLAVPVQTIPDDGVAEGIVPAGRSRPFKTRFQLGRSTVRRYIPSVFDTADRCGRRGTCPRACPQRRAPGAPRRVARDNGGGKPPAAGN